jgi:polar amino acid transport system substrate-binding protein
VQKGSIQEGLAQKYMANSEIKALGKISDIILSLKDKKIDAAIIEQPVAQANVNKNTDLAISEIKLPNEDAGSAIAVRKNSGALLDEINKTLKKLMDEKKIDEFVIKANELVD